MPISKFRQYLDKRGITLPSQWRPIVMISLGCIIGMLIYVLKISNAASYLSDDPQACVNCHIMNPHYITWNHSSHREVAHCNDCHVPHNNVFNKYFFKAKDGLYHATIFTLRAEPQVIRARKPSIRVIKDNCIRCHENQVTDAKLAGSVYNHYDNRTDRICWDCHTEVPHGRVKSLSAVGHQIEPIREYKTDAQQIVPKWLQEEINFSRKGIKK